MVLDVGGQTTVVGFDEKEFDAALGPAGYPKAADPAAIDRPVVVGLLTLLMLYVTMVYGPIAAFLVELFPRASAIRRCRCRIILATAGLAASCRSLPPPLSSSRETSMRALVSIAVALMSLIVGWLALPETKDNDINA